MTLPYNPNTFPTPAPPLLLPILSLFLPSALIGVQYLGQSTWGSKAFSPRECGCMRLGLLKSTVLSDWDGTVPFLPRWQYCTSVRVANLLDSISLQVVHVRNVYQAVIFDRSKHGYRLGKIRAGKLNLTAYFK